MVLTIDLTLTHGGGQQVLLDFIRVAQESGQKVRSLIASGGWMEKSLQGAGDPVPASVPSRERSWVFWRGLRLLRFAGILLRHRDLLRNAQVIVVNDPELFLPAAMLASLMGKEVTLYLHMAYRGLAATVLRLAARFSSVTRLICVSHFVKTSTEKLVSGSIREKLVVLQNALSPGVVIPERGAPPRDVRRVAIIGRLVPEKGQGVVCALSHALPETNFYLIGPLENADLGYLERLRRGSASNVRFVGYKHPIIRYLQEEDIGIVLVPSRIEEACPLVPIEAAAAGCAVVVRDLGGLAEVAANAGLMAVDSDEQFLDAIARLQAMKPEALASHVLAARRQALSHYHPARFKREVIETFGWR